MGVDVYSMVADRIIATMETGVVPWHKPWKGGSNLAISHVTGKPYSLLNQMCLDGQPGEYVTFKQCVEEGGHVRKGEKSKIVIFWKFLEEVDKETGETKYIPFLRYHNVFNLSQCEGIKPRFSDLDVQMGSASPDEEAEKIIENYITNSGVTLIKCESRDAYYSPSTDTVVIPLITQFENTAEFYSTAFHELTHSTGHVSRLNRLDRDAHFGNEVYSKEELVAELGAAMLVNHVGLETESSFNNNAAYISGWLDALKKDKKLIVTAAGRAEKAVKLILNEQDEE